MLHVEAITAETLDLLIKIQSIEEFSKLRLVGGTSLALQYGHRLSVDLDLFGDLEVQDEELLVILNNVAPTIPLKLSRLIKSVVCNEIKIDFVRFDYPWLEQAIGENGIRLASDKDIAAMKMSAIAGRGSKKDFFDLHELLKRFSLDQIFSFYESKFPNGSVYLVAKSMIYFEDAEMQEDPVSLNNTKWPQVKSSIIAAHSKWINNL